MLMKTGLPALCLALAMLAPVSAGAGAELPKAELGEKGKNQASVSQGNIKAILSYRSAKQNGNPEKIPYLQVMDGTKTVLTLKGVSSGFDWPIAEATIAEMDPANPYPEVVFSSFSGGAHCCLNVLIATSSPDGTSWQVVKAGDYDGGFVLEDLDGDRRAEFQVRDQRFLYAFASYAGSMAPPRIFHLQGPKLIDMTREAPFRTTLLKQVAELDRQVAQISGQHERNGLLAGYVALKSLVGQGADGWEIMMRNYDRKASTGLTGCQAGYDAEGRCKAPETRFPDFPRALEAFLKRAGYL